jgi:predicted hydrocarbon binding protein
MIIFSAEMLSKVLTELYRTFGTGASFILYKLGFDYGEGLATHFKRMLAAISGGVEFPPKKVLETFLKYNISAGWQCLEGFEISTEGRIEASVKVKDLWEALARKGLKMEELNCDLFRGILAGFFTALYGIEFRAVEVSCEAKGASHCEFHIVKQA